MAAAPGFRNGNNVLSNRTSISMTGIPVGGQDKDMAAHVWLMFASQCYWSNLHTNWGSVAVFVGDFWDFFYFRGASA
jgi:hypothetical protein